MTKSWPRGGTLAAMLALLGPIAAIGHDLDLKRLPLGDGRLSNAPRTGWIWACRIDPLAGGAFRAGPWIDAANGTFDLTAKVAVGGAATWPHQLRITRRGDKRIIESNDLPNHPTGAFPIASGDPAYQYDRNPNRITPQRMRLELPAMPALASPACTPAAVGILLTGVALFNALDAPGRDAVAHETQDRCQGHPQISGVYHYHSLTSCIDDKPDSTGHSPLIGYALDGFGIFGNYHDGKRLASADLDPCHGHVHAIEWDGKKAEMFHYHATPDFPYTIGCMRGAYKPSDVRAVAGPPPGPRRAPGGGGHPDFAAAAQRLGIPEQKLRDALGPPPPDFAAAARRLGIGEARLRQALGAP